MLKTDVLAHFGTQQQIADVLTAAGCKNSQQVISSWGEMPDYLSQRDEGIARAVSHADALDPEWSDTAFGMLQEFCTVRRGCLFTSEDVRRWCDIRGFETPVAKAWGHIMLRGARTGLIVKVGYTVAKQRHGSPCPQWKAA